MCILNYYLINTFWCLIDFDDSWFFFVFFSFCISKWIYLYKHYIQTVVIKRLLNRIGNKKGVKKEQNKN